MRRRFVAGSFTLVEVLVVLAVIGLLAGLLLPALVRAKARASAAACAGNVRQLQVCWQLYADDYGGHLPPNRSVRTNGVWRSTPDSWIGDSSAPTDPDTRRIENGLLFKYDYNRSVAIYRCPADHSTVRAGLPRTRSYAMNGNLGGRTSEVQTVITRADDIPDATRLFVFVDEHEESIDDAHFLVWPYPDDRWVNMPADRHNRAGTFSFADGHAAVWRWQWPKQFKLKESYWKRAEGPADLGDLRRLQAAALLDPDYRRQP